MEFKFLMAALLVVMSSSRYEATTCPRWVKLNKSPVCFGAKGNQFGRFSYHRNIFVSSFMLVHRSGKVTCNKSDYSFWGCTPNISQLAVLLTDQNNKILAPEATTSISKSGWYGLAGYSSSSAVLVFCATKKPQCVFANNELRLWYGEDLRYPASEGDKGGKTCADVYGLFA